MTQHHIVVHLKNEEAPATSANWSNESHHQKPLSDLDVTALAASLQPSFFMGAPYPRPLGQPRQQTRAAGWLRKNERPTAFVRDQLGETSLWQCAMPLSPRSSLTLDAVGWLMAALHDVPLSTAADSVLGIWQARIESGVMSPQTVDKFGLLIRRFARFCAAHDATTPAQVSPALAIAFVTASGRNRSGAIVAPTVATQHQRRAVLRLFARDAIAAGYLLTDPTEGLALPPREQFETRPVTEDEATLLRRFAESWATPTRHAATIALALAGVHTGEIAAVRLRDVSADRVCAPGTLRCTTRSLPLDAWSVRVIRERVEAIRLRSDGTPDSSLVSTGRGTAAQQQARACTAIRDVVRRAGLGAEPDIKPTSVSHFAAAQTFARTQRIDAAATVLGYASLDAAARAIGWDWQGEIQ